MRYIFLVFFLALTGTLLAQSVNAPLNQEYYHWIDRYEIKQGEINPYFHSSWKPYQRKEIAAFIKSLPDQSLTDQDAFNKSYLLNDNWEWIDSLNNQSKKPFLKHFYKVKSDLYHVDQPEFDLHVNPVLYLGAGVESAADDNTFINTRGVQVRGMIDGKLGFYTFIGENQIIFPNYVRNRIAERQVVPNEGFWKTYNDNGVDFFTARGYISFQATKHINLQFGHDRFKVGNGYRSMILSDNAPAYLFFKMDTKVWKIKYTNLFTQLTADTRTINQTPIGPDRYPSKYMALHHLSLNISKKLNIGIFESIIYSTDSIGNSADFDMQYLNPIIFYRAIEQQNGSPDNALLGLDFKWLVAKRFSLYGQFVLDEFLLDNLREGNGWWANKYGIQVGGEYIDVFGLDNFDLQAEVNISRPYTYSHGTIYGSYSHYRQALAHPIGANFKEFVGVARYQPIPRLNIKAKLIYADYGLDTASSNWGTDILLQNTSREQDFNNEIGQGVATSLIYGNLTLSYQWRHNFFIDLSHTFRKVDSEIDLFDANTNYTSAAIRWNIPQRLNEF